VKKTAKRRPRAALSEKQRENLARNSWKKGQSGNPSGRSKDDMNSFARATKICRDLALTDETIEAIKKILYNARKPKLQLEAWRILLERALGAPMQPILLKQMGVLDGADGPGGDGAQPFVFNPEDPQQIANAGEVFRRLRDLKIDEPTALPAPAEEPEPVRAEPAPEPRGFEPRKVVPMLRGPERFGAGRFEIITDDDRKKF
jgi:Family of unknown function (DUF5681)